MSKLLMRVLLAAVVAVVVVTGVFAVGKNIVDAQQARAVNAAEAARYNEKVPAPQPAAAAPVHEAALATAPAEAWFTGDSLTVGWHATTEADAFPGLVVTELGANITDTTVTARAGATLQEVADDYDIPSGVGLVVVELGTNDAQRGTDPALFADQYTAYLDQIRDANPDAELVCLGVWFLSSQAQTGPLDRAIRSSCEAHDGTFQPLTDIVADASTRGPDGAKTWIGPADTFHPNNTGHERIADRVLTALR